MKQGVLTCIILCGLTCIGWAADQPQMSKKKLEQPTEIQGYPCAKGYAWFFADDHLAKCFVSRDIAFGEAVAPTGSLIILRPDGKPRWLGLSRDTQIHGYTCRGGGLLGPAEGYTTAFYPSGKLELCWLAGDQQIQGVPCMGASFSHAVAGAADDGAHFYESGKLRSCRLSKDVGSRRKAQQFLQAP